jgi:hypothetical protein
MNLDPPEYPEVLEPRSVSKAELFASSGGWGWIRPRLDCSSRASALCRLRHPEEGSHIADKQVSGSTRSGLSLQGYKRPESRCSKSSDPLVSSEPRDFSCGRLDG